MLNHTHALQIRLSPSADLSVCSLQEAIGLLPFTRVFRLQVHPAEFAAAQTVVEQVAPSVEKAPLTAHIAIELCPAQEVGAWAVWSGDSYVWSSGA